MPAFDFPTSPANGQVSNGYTWDGQKWIAGVGTSGAPSNTNPIMDGIAVPGDDVTYSRGDHVHPSDTTKASTSYVDTQDATKLSKAANLSDVANITTARQSIYAAPFDALAYNGMQINGAFEVNQSGTVGPDAAAYVCDGWRFINTTGTYSAQQIKNPYLPGLEYYFHCGISVAPTIVDGSYIFLDQPIEGWRMARLGWGTASAQPITIGFFTAHQLPGTYSVTIQNGAQNRSYAATYTQVAAGVVEYKYVTIPGDTTGTWAKDTAVGAWLSFALAMGATQTAPAANVWTAGNYHAAPGQVNGAVTSNVFRLGGVVVLPGVEAPSAARASLIMRPYDQELLTCQRYWQQCLTAFDFQATVNGQISASTVEFSPRMRDAPTMQLHTQLVAPANISTPALTFAFPHGAFIQATAPSTGRSYWYSHVLFNARLP